MIGRIMIAAVLAAALSPAVAPADEHRQCVAVGAMSATMPTDGSPWQCEFTASGPVDYVAATPGPFAITVYRDGGWVDLVRRPGVGAPMAGTLASVAAGERVSVNVSCWNWTAGTPCASGCFPGPCGETGSRNGIVIAGSLR